MCWDFIENCIFAVVKRWIAVEGHSYVPTLSTNVLHGCWILGGIGLPEKCQLHLRKVWSANICLLR